MPTPREVFAAKFGEKAAQLMDRKFLEGITNAAAATIQEDLKAQEAEKLIGFTLIMFTFGDKGAIAYASTAQKEDFLRALDELRGNLAAELQAAKGD